MRLVEIDGCLINTDKILFTIPTDDEKGTYIYFSGNDEPLELSASTKDIVDAINTQTPLLLTEVA